MDYKGYDVQPLGTFPMFNIKNKGSGPVPKALSGDFTSMREVKLAIDGYLEGLKKGPKNGKAKVSGNS